MKTLSIEKNQTEPTIKCTNTPTHPFHAFRSRDGMQYKKEKKNHTSSNSGRVCYETQRYSTLNFIGLNKKEKVLTKPTLANTKYFRNMNTP